MPEGGKLNGRWSPECDNYRSIRATLTGISFQNAVDGAFAAGDLIIACSFDHRPHTHPSNQSCDSPDIVFYVKHDGEQSAWRWDGIVGTLRVETELEFFLLPPDTS